MDYITNETQMVTDAPNNSYNTSQDNTYVEADGIYYDEGMVTEDSKKKKKTKTLIYD